MQGMVMMLSVHGDHWAICGFTILQPTSGHGWAVRKQEVILRYTAHKVFLRHQIFRAPDKNAIPRGLGMITRYGLLEVKMLQQIFTTICGSMM